MRLGIFLVAHDYFLQQPHDFNLSTRYYNPQYLVRPNSEFQVSWENRALESVHSFRLSEKRKSKVSQILDSATGPTSFSEVQVSHRLKTDLLLHQKKALAMMVEKESGGFVGLEFPSVWTESNETGECAMKVYRNSVTGAVQLREPELCLGGILADDMGLGKTLPTLALIAGSLNDSAADVEEVKPLTLIVVPLSTLPNWENQIQKHFRKGSLRYTLYHGPARPKDAAFLTKYSVILTTYDTLKADYREHSSRAGLLHGLCWHRIVLDEAHVIRNQSSQVFRSVRSLSAKHRWCITATPIQNLVEDLGTLVEFLRVWPFDSPFHFRQNFVIPINDGDSHGWQRLRSLVEAISLRRTKDIVELTLPAREEIIQSVELDTEENEIYRLFTRSCVSAIETRGSARSCFQNILRLRQICNHGRDLLPPDTRRWLDSVMSTDDNSGTPGQSCENCDGAIQDSDSEMDELLGCFHQICKACFEAAQDGDSPGEPFCPLCSESGCEDKKDRDACDIDSDTSYRPSSKVRALLENLRKNDTLPLRPGEMPIKSVIFSAWAKMLDLVEKALEAAGLRFQRIDGSKNLQYRKHALHHFRIDPSCTILLATLGSAGVG
ncbi:hypothetical protein K469DRAFT_597047 [Zopfia rhizophila CBS 207.26]|uniref:Helicase ATP-binding domain-containing protein n=1 Tax=Zopfia rhizophila CBS 207.26 TaxID=1314779 RepID=A0A6A6DI63_9PEZI|nr:hypothetical protein K469DRAFT_597047 [Zopfia rhizophila CBS 207.26]